MVALVIDDTVRKLDRTISDLVLEYQGDFGFETQLFLPTKENVETLFSTIRSQQDQVARADIDPFWTAHFNSVLRGLKMAGRTHQLYPYNYIHTVAGFLGKLMDFDINAPQEKVKQATGKLRRLAPVLDEVIRLVKPLPPSRKQQVANSATAITSLLARMLDYFAGYQDQIEPESLQALGEQVHINQAALAAAVDAIEKMPAYTGNEEEASLPFDQVMGEGLQVPLDFILSWYKDDFLQRKEEFYELGRTIDPRRDPFAILQEDSPAYDNPQRLFEDARRVVNIMREYSLDYVTLPEGEVCEVGPVAEQSKMDCPTANCGGADMWTGTLRSRMGLNEDNYTAFNRASLWDTVAHECYPGHHTNAAKGAAVDLPRTFRLYLPLVRAMVEGIAHRSETLMAPHYEDDLARLSAAHRVYYCAARVKAEMDLNYYRRSPQELMRMYQEDLQVNEMTARLQVQAHLMYPGDAISYYTGARVLESRRRELGVEARPFTEPIFSFGFVSLDTMNKLVAMSPRDGETIKQFGSL